MNKKPVIVVGADHGGFDLKEAIKTFLGKDGYTVKDAGNTIMDPDDDYADFAKKVAQEVGAHNTALGQNEVKGILLCRSAAGMVIAANKVKGVRAVAAFDEESAKHSREHNDANVLALSGDRLSDEQAKGIVRTWLETPYSFAERHTRRLQKILSLEK